VGDLILPAAGDMAGTMLGEKTKKLYRQCLHQQHCFTTHINNTIYSLILIDGAVVEHVESFKFLGVHINNKLEWSKHTKTIVKRARQSLFPLRKLKSFGMGPQILKWFDNCTIESMVASLPGTAIARPLTARHYRG
jgi:hypothetical protein